MRLVDKRLSAEEIGEIVKEFGEYVKLTVDIENGWVAVGPELHADAVSMLKEKGSLESDIWGGWIDLGNKEIETMAVWNLRSEPDNPSTEIVDVERRDRFIKVVKNIFGYLWI